MIDRRDLLAGRVLAAAPLIAAACAPDARAAGVKGAKVLVAYFTRSGNTRAIAGTLQRALDAELFEITPGRPYPADYEQTVAQATRERDGGFEPPLASTVSGIESHDAIFLGFPIWGET